MSHVPQLAAQCVSSRVDRVDYFLPAGQRRLAMKARDVRIVERGRATNTGSFGDDETDAVAAHVAGSMRRRRRPGMPPGRKTVSSSYVTARLGTVRH